MHRSDVAAVLFLVEGPVCLVDDLPARGASAARPPFRPGTRRHGSAGRPTSLPSPAEILRGLPSPGDAGRGQGRSHEVEGQVVDAQAQRCRFLPYRCRSDVVSCGIRVATSAQRGVHDLEDLARGASLDHVGHRVRFCDSDLVDAVGEDHRARLAVGVCHRRTTRLPLPPLGDRW